MRTNRNTTRNRVIIILGLRCFTSSVIVWSCSETDIKFRDSDFDTEIKEALLGCYLISSRRCCADLEMGFKANTVDLNVACLEFLDEIVGRGCFVARVLKTVVVIVELYVCMSLFYGFLGELVGEEEILGTDCVIPLGD